MPFLGKQADLLERSLQGLPGADQEVSRLTATAGQIPILTARACGPSDDFVSSLGLRLRAEALTLPARPVARPSSATAQRHPATRPAVLVLGRGLRVFAGAAASLVLIAAILGVTSRSALPGGVLYSLKQVLNSAAVDLAGSDHDRGVTLLSQAQGHIGDARSLAERDRALADPALVDQALLGAFDSTRSGQRALLGEFARTRDTRALVALQDFTARALPQLKALRAQVPPASRPQVDALIALLHQTRTTVAHTIAVCGQRCDSIGSAPPGSRPAPAPATGLPLNRRAGGLPVPGVPTSGLPTVGPVPAITGPGVVGPVAPPLPIPQVTVRPVLPPVRTGQVTVSPSPVVIPPLPKVSPPAPLPGQPPPPTGIPGLP